MSISPDLRFHLQGNDDPNEVWENIEYVIGKHNIIRAHRIENKIMNLSPNDFSCIEDYLSKIKTIRVLCEECGIKLEEDCFIYIILSKLGIAYLVFVSTLYATKEYLGSAYKNSSLDCFCDALIREKYKLVQLGVVSTAGTSNKSLVVQ
jgi:hypothetical protein